MESSAAGAMIAASGSTTSTRLVPLASVLFPETHVLLPSLAAYELQLAYLKSQSLPPDQLVNRGAYFMRIGDELTDHFRLCSGAPIRLAPNSSEKLRSFFTWNLYRTGYASHGLFPYRGKFHPQMIRALINVMGLQRGETLLDPMMGSGTALIEASIMGIRALGFDASPFCAMMADAKSEALRIAQTELQKCASQLLAWVRTRSGGSKGNPPTQTHESLREVLNEASAGVAKVLELAYLDAMGFWWRRSSSTFVALLEEVLERYSGVVGKFERAASALGLELAEASARLGDARKLPIDSDSVDGVLFSPPYSFAIDYVENDEPQLRYFGVDLVQLRDGMIGLRGRFMRDRVSLYLQDMSLIMGEVSRVLKRGKFATMIVGSNTRQLSAALRVPEEKVQGLEEQIIAFANTNGLRLQMLLERPIHGISNTMRHEFIIILQKP